MNLNKTLDSFVIIKNSNEKIVNENDNNIIKRKETSPEKKTEKKSKKSKINNSNNNNSTIEINSKEQKSNSIENNNNNSSKEENNNSKDLNNNKINNYPNLKFYPTYTSFISCLSSWQEPLSNFISPPSNKTMLFIYNFIKNEYETKTIFPPMGAL